jgi:tetratricopeptide (TPR) repeat protein
MLRPRLLGVGSMKPFAFLSIAALTLSLTTFPPAYADSAFDRGVESYTSGDYPVALLQLSQACGENPRNVMAHYYLANTLVQQKMHDQAVSEYSTCYRLDPHGPVAEFCMQALRKYRALKKNNNPTLVASANVPGEPDISRAQSLIRRQAEYEKAKHHDIGESLARGTSTLAEVEARRAHTQAQEEIDRVLAPPIFFPIGRPPVNAAGYTPEQGRARAEEIRRNAEETAQLAKLRAAGRAQQYRDWSSQRKHALDEVVMNLEKQLASPASSGVKLQPVGTDLYVRFYGYKRATAQMPNTRPADVRLVDKETIRFESAAESAAPVELRATPKHLDPRVVRGKLMQKQLR